MKQRLLMYMKNVKKPKLYLFYKRSTVARIEKHIIKKLFKLNRLFEYSKPVNLIKDFD